MSRRPLLLAAVAVAALVASPAPASAQSAADLPSLSMPGTTDRGRFVGRLDVARFTLHENELVVVGRLVGRLRDRRYPGPQPVDQRGRFRATVAAVPGKDCAQLVLALAGRLSRVFGLRTTFAAQTYTLRPRRGGPPAVPDLLCATSQTLSAQPPQPGQPFPPVVLHLLNALRLSYA